MDEKQAQKEHLKRQKELERAFAAICSFEGGEGLTVLRYICHQVCGFRQTTSTLNEQCEVNVQATLWNLSRRDSWLQIQQHIPPDMLALIELGDKKQ